MTRQCRPAPPPQSACQLDTKLHEAHVKEENARVLGGGLLDRLVEGGTRLGPGRPEIQKRDTVEVLGELLLELLR